MYVHVSAKCSFALFWARSDTLCVSVYVPTCSVSVNYYGTSVIRLCLSVQHTPVVQLGRLLDQNSDYTKKIL
jgi:hypothetical protein